MEKHIILLLACGTILKAEPPTNSLLPPKQSRGPSRSYGAPEIPLDNGDNHPQSPQFQTPTHQLGSGKRPGARYLPPRESKQNGATITYRNRGSGGNSSTTHAVLVISSPGSTNNLPKSGRTEGFRGLMPIYGSPRKDTDALVRKPSSIHNILGQDANRTGTSRPSLTYVPPSLRIYEPSGQDSNDFNKQNPLPNQKPVGFATGANGNRTSCTNTSSREYSDSQEDGRRNGQTPTDIYGPPLQRGKGGRQPEESHLPSEGNGEPGVDDDYTGGPGYEEEDNSTEPTKSENSHRVNAPEFGAQFGHQESTLGGDKVTSEYKVLLPNSRKQVVQYEGHSAEYTAKIPTYDYEGPTNDRYSSGGPPGRNDIPPKVQQEPMEDIPQVVHQKIMEETVYMKD